MIFKNLTVKTIEKVQYLGQPVSFVTFRHLGRPFSETSGYIQGGSPEPSTHLFQCPTFFSSTKRGSNVHPGRLTWHPKIIKNHSIEKGKSSSKPPFLGSMLIFQSVCQSFGSCVHGFYRGDLQALIVAAEAGRLTCLIVVL